MFQILGALNAKALPTNAFGGMGVLKQMLADDRRVVGLYISIRSRIYDGDKLFNDLKTRQAILKSTPFCTGNQCNNLRELFRIMFTVFP